MERRQVQRFALDLAAEATPAGDSRAGFPGDEVRIRDISSSGASFFSGTRWETDQEVVVLVRFDEKLLGEHAYTGRFGGRVVREGIEQPGAKNYYAVRFTEPMGMRGRR